MRRSSTSKAVASSGREAMVMSRSCSRIRCTYAMVASASLAGSTVKSWSYLFFQYRASFARRPARASGNGDDSRPSVETSTKLTGSGMTRSSRHARGGVGGRVPPRGRERSGARVGRGEPRAHVDQRRLGIVRLGDRGEAELRDRARAEHEAVRRAAELEV